LRVYLARHGETTWNVDGRYQGQRDESILTPRGEFQAAALARAMNGAELRAVISSPLQRCVATANAVAERVGLTVQPEPLLREIGHGTWEGLLKAEVERNEPELIALWRERPYEVAFTGGETLEEVRERWRTFAHGFRPHGPTLIVTHDVLVRLALIECGAYEASEFWSVRCTNGAYAVFDAVDAAWTLVQPYVDEHLHGLIADTSGQAL